MGTNSGDDSVLELALEIEADETLETTVSNIISCYMSALGCDAVGVFRGDLSDPSGFAMWDSSEGVPTDQFYSAEEFNCWSDADSSLPNYDGVSSVVKVGKRDTGVYCYTFSIGGFGYLCVVSPEVLSMSRLDTLDAVHDKIGRVCSTVWADTVSDSTGQSDSVDLDMQSNLGHFSNPELPDSGGYLMDLLSDYTGRLLSSSTRNDVCEKLVAAVNECIGADVICVYVYDRSTDTFSQQGSNTSENVFKDVYESDVVFDEVIEDGKMSFDQFTDSTSIMHHQQINSCSLLPIGGYGVLLFGSRGDKSFTAKDTRIASFFTHITYNAFDQIRFTEGLQSINEFAEDVSDATSREYVVNAGIGHIENSLDFPFTAVWEYNPITNMLQPSAQSTMSAELVGKLPTFGQSNSVAWSVYQNSSLEVIQDSTARSQTNDPTIKSEVLIPVGDFGVLATGSLRKSNINTVDIEVSKVLASTMQSAVESSMVRGQIDLIKNTVFRALRHNIRNDITVLDGYLDIVESEVDDADKFDIIQNKVQSIENVVEKSRLLRRVIQSQQKRAALDPHDIVDVALESIPSQFDEFETYVTVECDDRIIGHPQLPAAVGQLVENVVEHASDEATTLRVSIRSSDNMAIIAIADNGQGIPKNEISVLGDKESMLEHGSGLGLWVVETIVENSDGRLSVYSSNGTTAEITVDVESSGE